MTDKIKRLSQLADMCCTHIVYGRIDKALLIAQYIRRACGMGIIPNLKGLTGHRRINVD